MDTTKPTIIFLYGFGVTNILWRQHTEYLSGKIDTHTLNIPPINRSGTSANTAIKEYASGVIHILRRSEVAKPVLCSHGMGGAIILQMLLDNPAYLAGGVIVNSSARLRLFPTMTERIEKTYEDFNSDTNQGIDTWCSDENDYFDISNRLREIELPILAICGLDDEVVPPENSKLISNKVPNSQYFPVKDAGHMLPLEKPTLISKKIEEFIINMIVQKSAL